MATKTDKAGESEQDPKGKGAEAEAEREAAGEGSDDTEADAGGDEDDGEPAEGEDKKAAKGDSEETPAQRRARLARDPEVAALVKQQAKAAAAKAVREALAAQEAEAAKRAKLAAATEAERAAAERDEALAKTKAAEERATAAEMDLAFYRTVVASGVRLADPGDMPFVQQAAAKLMADEDLDVEEALAAVAKAKPHWFVPSDEEVAAKKAKAKEVAAKKATTTAEPKGTGTERKPETQPKTKSVREMTPAEFAAHQRQFGYRPH
jgi:hypothetical protein